MMRRIKQMVTGGLAVCLLAAGASTASAVTIQRDTAPASPDLSALANQDWVLDKWSDGYRYQMSGGDNSISAPTALQGTLTSPSGGSKMQFSFSDGDPAASGGASTTMDEQPVAGFIDNALSTVGNGFEFDIAGAGLEQTAYIWVSGYQATAQFTAILNGQTYVFDGQDTYGKTKTPVLYTVTFTTDEPGTPLTLRYEVTEHGNDNSHVLYSGAALNVVPEPGTLALMGLGGLLLVRRRRRMAVD